MHMEKVGARGISTALLVSCTLTFGVDCQLKSSLKYTVRTGEPQPH